MYLRFMKKMVEDMEKEILAVKCPLCKETHEYSLEVEKDTVFYYITEEILSQSPKQRSFVRLLMCPNNQKMFQATITVNGTVSKIIKDVKVKGVLKKP